MPPETETEMVFVRMIGSDGELTEPMLTPKVILADDVWKERLTPQQYRITRRQRTESAFCGGLLHSQAEGLYLCLCCDLPLFFSNAKFDSGTGWPSFFQPASQENVIEKRDDGHGMVRTEILCRRCDAHLGHLFPDGPQPTGLRYCLNSESMRFTPTDQLAAYGESATQAEVAEVVLAGGCFWCVEAVFLEIEGVLGVTSGYAGGDSAATANYEAVCGGKTGHAEVVKIVYDPGIISYERVLEVHFGTHDPTTLNRQGNDAGEQYRSAIFYVNDQEEKRAEAVIQRLTEDGGFHDPIVTTLEPLEEFFPAEPYHQNYACRNPSNPYVMAVTRPKVEKAREKFKEATGR
jgi:peptide methionine sulfoxide reductase msrA/msrB